MKIEFICPCGSNIFRLYYSWNKAQCHYCLKEYELQAILGEIKIEHQRG